MSNPKVILIGVTISIAFSYFSLAVAGSIVIGIATPLHELCKLSLPNQLLYFLSGLVQTVLVITILNTKRFKHGMPYLYSSKFLNLGSFLSIITIIVYIYNSLSPSTQRWNKLFISLIPVLGFFLLLHWWQSQLTKAYRQRLAQMELESLRTELDQKMVLLKKLETQNEEMGRLIHKDNKLIPAMEHAVSTYLTSDFTDIALQQAQGQALLYDLKEFSEARRGILSNFTCISAPKYNTGIPSLDAILVYMYQKAHSQNIRFYATVTPESIAVLPLVLTTEKLVHLLSDLLENAIIASKTSIDKQVQFQIYLANGITTIEVADTGCPFEPTTLISFGIEKASTHLNDGGSGIGLLDIWKIKEETKASIHIHEYEMSTPFSKKLFLSFDKKNKYVIHTWRNKELTPLTNRGDIIILAQE